jgi:hypothetical protein
MTMRVNLIHSKLVFLKKKKLNTLKKKTKKVHSNNASELHYARKHRILQSSYQLLCKIRVQNVKLHGTHYN